MKLMATDEKEVGVEVCEDNNVFESKNCEDKAPGAGPKRDELQNL